MLGETKNQFFLTCGALSTCERPKKQFPIRIVLPGEVVTGLLLACCLTFCAPDTSVGDGLGNWTARYSGVSRILGSVAFNGTRFAVTCQGGVILTSEDGVVWTARSSGTSDYLGRIGCGAGLFVVGTLNQANPGRLLTSQDGLAWTLRSAGVNDYLCSVGYGNGTFVAGGTNGSIVTSTDGVNWTPRASAAGRLLLDICYGNGVFVAVGAQPPDNHTPILTSVDGATWTARSSGLAEPLNAVAFGNGKFVAGGAIGGVTTSQDGINWAGGSVFPSRTFSTVSYAQGFYVAVADEVTYVYPPGYIQYVGFLLTSLDGATWTTRLSDLSYGLHGVCFGAGSFVAVGDSGKILQSGYVGPPALGAVGFSQASGLGMSLAGEAERSYRLQAAADSLSTNWVDLLAFTLTGTQRSTNFVDAAATNFSRRFYRVVSP